MPGESDPSTAGADTKRPGSFDETWIPRDLKVRIAEQRLLIDWSDNRRSEFSLHELRRICPCASCRTEREQQGNNPLRILKSDPTGVRVVHAELVGNYAIKFRWSDGHDTGIFEFRMLRGLGCDGEISRG